MLGVGGRGGGIAEHVGAEVMTAHLPAGHGLDGNREGGRGLLRSVQPVPDMALLNLEAVMLTKSAGERRLTANQVAGALQGGEFGVVHGADDTSMLVDLSTRTLVARFHKDAGTVRCMRTLGERLRAVREERGLSQKGLAAKVGVSQQLIGQIEKDENQGTKHIAKLAHALEVSSYWLETGNGPREPVRSDSLTEQEQRIIAKARAVGDADALQLLESFLDKLPRRRAG